MRRRDPEFAATAPEWLRPRSGAVPWRARRASRAWPGPSATPKWARQRDRRHQQQCRRQGPHAERCDAAQTGPTEQPEKPVDQVVTRAVGHDRDVAGSLAGHRHGRAPHAVTFAPYEALGLVLQNVAGAAENLVRRAGKGPVVVGQAPVHGRAHFASIGGTGSRRERSASSYALDRRRPTHRQRIETDLTRHLHEFGHR